MDTNFYDVIVCGSEPAGIIAAALLGRRGFRVLLVGHDGERASLELPGATLSRAPALVPPPDGPLFSRVLQELSLVQLLRRRARLLSPGFQVALPRHRFDVPADAAWLRREVRREWPSDVEAIESAVARMADVANLLDPLLATEMALPPEGFWERRELARLESLLPRPETDLLAPLEPRHPFRAVAALPAALGTALGPGEAGLVTRARAFTQARRGEHLLEGGEAAWRALFLDKIETFSGERRDKALPVEIVERRGRAVGLRVRPRDETIGCRYLVWAGPASGAVVLLGERSSSARRAHEAAASLRPICYRYTMALAVRPAAIPEGMSGRTYFIADPARALLEENAFAVTVGAPTARETNQVPVWVECLVPAPAVDAGPGHLTALRGRLRDRLDGVMPFFDRHLIALASAHDGLPPEIPGATTKLLPLAAQPMPAVYSAEQTRPFDVSGLGYSALGIKNLLLAGRENLPGLGVEGDLVSAWSVVRLLAAAHPKKDLLRRQILVGEP